MNKQTMKNKDYKYSIRKLSWGAGSVAVSTVVTMSVFGLLSTDIFASETEPTSIIETIEQSDFEKETSINAIIEEDNQQQDTEVENQDIDDAMIIETQESTVETQDTDTETIVEQQESITETTSEKIVENVVEDVNEEDSLSVQEQSISIDLTSTVSNSASYSIENNVITILTGGDYIFTGENQLAQIVIDASVTEDVIIRRSKIR